MTIFNPYQVFSQAASSGDTILHTPFGRHEMRELDNFSFAVYKKEGSIRTYSFVEQISASSVVLNQIEPPTSLDFNYKRIDLVPKVIGTINATNTSHAMFNEIRDTSAQMCLRRLLVQELRSLKPTKFIDKLDQRSVIPALRQVATSSYVGISTILIDSKLTLGVRPRFTPDDIVYPGGFLYLIPNPDSIKVFTHIEPLVDRSGFRMYGAAYLGEDIIKVHYNREIAVM